MTLKKMNAFMNAVLALRPSASQSSQHMFPRVLLERLTSKTIKQHTNKHERSQWSDNISKMSDVSPSNKEPFGKSISSFMHESQQKEELPGTQSEIDSNSDGQSSSSSISNPPVIISDESQKKRNEILDKLTEEVTESDETASSCNSDDLPDLNDPSWGKEGKKNKVKRRKRKNKDAPKRDAKLMKHARKVFEHQAFRYKSSKDFMKSSKVTKEVESAVQSDHRDNTASLFKAVTAPMEGKEISKENVTESPTKSAAELMSLKLKESMARYVGQEKENNLSEDSTDLELQLFDTYVPKDKKTFRERKSNQDEEPLVSLDSDESNSTVVFEDLHIQDIRHLEPVQPQSEESLVADDDGSSLTKAVGNSNELKRKNSPLGTEDSAERCKKLKSDDEIIPNKKDVHHHPMVLIPAPSLVCAVSQTHMPLQSQSSSVVSKTAFSIQTSVEKETSELHSNLSPEISDADVTGSSVNSADPGKRLPYLVPVPREECIDIDSSTSHESEKSSDEDIPVTTLVTQEAISQEKTNASHNIMKNLDNKNAESQEQTTDSSKIMKNPVRKGESQEENVKLKKVVVGSNEKPFKSLKQLSQLQELMGKKTLWEEKIRQLKVEYNSKLETLEEEKKVFEVKMAKLVAAMSTCKELSVEEQQEPAAADSAVNVGETGSVVTAMPPASTTPTLTSQSIPVATAPAQKSENTNVVVYGIPEKMAINVIPAASIRNFGTKRLTVAPKAAAPSSHPPQLQTDLQKQQSLRRVRKMATTTSSSHTSSGDLATTYGLQPRSDSAFDKQSPPNAVVIPGHIFDKHPPPNAVVVPGQQHPVSSHTMCRAAPRPTTHAVQRRVPVANLLRPVRANNPGALHTGHETSQTQQMQNMPSHHYIPVQLQQHQQQQQLQQQQQQLQQQQQQQPQLQQQQPQQQQRQQNIQQQQLQLSHNRQHEKKQQQQQWQQQQQQLVQLQPSGNTHLTQEHQQSQPHLQQYQPMQGRSLKNTAPVQGAAVPVSYSSPGGTSNINWTSAQIVPDFPLGTLIATGNSTSVPSQRIIVTHSQTGNPQINAGTNIEKASYIVSAPSVVSSVKQFQQHLQSLQSGTSNRVIGLSLPHVSHSSAPDNTDIPLSVETTPASSTNRHTSQSAEFPLPTPTPYTVEIDVQESGINEHICKMCGSPGIFTCCNNVIYCSTVCQGNDWASHKQQCTNTSAQDTS